MQKEGGFWDVLDKSSDAIIITDLKIPSRVSFWNKKAEELFGYNRFEVIGKRDPTILEGYKPEFKVIRKEILKINKISYKTKRKTKEGKLIDVFITASPFKRNEKIAGIISNIKPLSEIKNAPHIIDYIKKEKNGAKRTFFEIRKKILSELLKAESTINELSIKTNINWKTVENHLTYLVGRGLIKEVFSSEYVRIFKITDQGKTYILSNGNLGMNGFRRMNKRITKIENQ